MAELAPMPSAPDARGRSCAILVLGMHRSGTSAVARCLNILGADLGTNLLPPAAGVNAKGFWENADAVRINEELLTAFGRTWSDVRSLPADWLDSDAARNARARIVELVRAQFSGRRLWALKDPRLCRLLPLWRQVLTDEGIDVCALLVVRHPHEVSLSLKVRDNLPGELAHVLWMEHCVEAEIGSRGLRRTIVTYDHLLDDWAAELARVARDLRTDWAMPSADAAGTVNRYLDRGERHHKASATPGGVPRAIAELYAALCTVAKDEGGWAELSERCDACNALAPVFLAAAELLERDLRRRDERQRVYVERNLGESLATLERAAKHIGVRRTAPAREQEYALLYYRDKDSTFNERCTISAPVEWDLGSNQRLSFEIPEPKSVAALRFDPANTPGAFNVQTVRCDGVELADVRKRVRGVNQYLLDRQGGPGIWFASNDGDPWVELDITDLQRADGPARFEFECEMLALDAVMGALVASISADVQRSLQANLGGALGDAARRVSDAAGALQKRADSAATTPGAEALAAVEAAQSREAALREQMRVVQAARAAAEVGLESARARESLLQKKVRDAESRRQADLTELEQRKRREEYLDEQLRAATTSAAHAQADVNAALGREAELRAQLADERAGKAHVIKELADRDARVSIAMRSGAALSESLTALHETRSASQSINRGLVREKVRAVRRCTELENRLAQSRADLERVEHAYLIAHTTLLSIQQSTFWRVLGPARRIASHMPAPLRRLLRRTCKAAWWILTPWGLGRRLAFIKQRRAAQRGEGQR